MHVELVSPEAIVYTGEATMVLARTPEGEIGFQPGHIAFIGTLSGKGPVKVWLEDGSVLLVAVHSGFIQVANDNVTILSDVAELAGSIDVPRAEAAREAARNALATDPDDEAAQAALERAELRLLVAGADTVTAGAGRSQH
jgi:F-type H+-transporting ATPase subunit epsilon